MALCGHPTGPQEFIDRMVWQMQVTIPATEPASCYVDINEDVTFESLRALARVPPSGGDCVIQVKRALAGSCTEAAYGGVLTIPDGACESNVILSLADPRESDKFAFDVQTDSGAELVTVSLRCNKVRP